MYNYYLERVIFVILVNLMLINIKLNFLPRIISLFHLVIILDIVGIIFDVIDVFTCLVNELAWFKHSSFGIRKRLVDTDA